VLGLGTAGYLGYDRVTSTLEVSSRKKALKELGLSEDEADKSD
jgi:hypothetical protein